MPARNSSMEISSPEPVEEQSTSTRRKSGRVRHKPAAFAPTSFKRKRGDNDDVEDADMPDASSEEDDEEDASDEPDEEEVRESRKRKKTEKKKAATAPRKPAQKKAKPAVNGGDEARTLAMRPAKPSNAKARRTTKAATTAGAQEETGLYAEVFSRGNDLEDVAGKWLRGYQSNQWTALAELFNFILRSTGCELTVDEHDAEDVDHYAEKLADMQDEYQQQNVTEYPLIAKAKAANSFRRTFAAFLDELVKVLASSNVLYEDESAMDLILAFVGPMSSAANRPFRHTATLASLDILSSLCDVAQLVLESSGKLQRQAQGEKKKGRSNKGRVSELEKQVGAATEKQKGLELKMNEWFDTIYVHRYRDIDPKIRADCAQALGEWAIKYPEMFFEGTFLRYLGWVMSDAVAQTRHEVIKALVQLYKDESKFAGLNTFSERFRPRMVEMAQRDHDIGVRVQTIELLDVLREGGFLEPDDVDAIGRLIFDSELRVRKAVVPFFVASVNSVYESKVEEIGGQEALDEAFDDADAADDDFDNPRPSWLKIKAIAEMLHSYDAEDEMQDATAHGVPLTDTYLLFASGLDSRFSLAAEVIYDHVPELQQWEVLSGFLLYDHSRAGSRKSKTSDVNQLFLDATKLDEQEEILLLEVLHAAVKFRLKQTVEAVSDTKKSKKTTKKSRQEAEEEQETTTRHLALLIPRLLNKFGAVPDATFAVLRLEHVLNLEIFQELRQDLTAYSKLLDDIKKQFLTHSQSRIVEEASRALLHAKSFEDLGEVTEEKMSGLWDATIGAFNKLTKDVTLRSRGNLSENVLATLSNTVLRIRKLVEISDPGEHLETAATPSGRSKKAVSTQPVISSILEILSRGRPVKGLDEETNSEEDTLVLNAARLALQFFMWKISGFRTMVTTRGKVAFRLLEPVAEFRDRFADAISQVLQERPAADELRVSLAGAYLDLHVAFAGLLHARPATAAQRQQEEEDDDPADAYLSLVMEVPQVNQPLLCSVLAATEKSFAKRSQRSLEDEDVQDEPLTDEEPESDEEDEDDANATDALREQKLGQTLLAEQKLCAFAGRLVLGLLAGVLDGKEEGQIGTVDGKKTGLVEKRLRRNYKRLGPNFKAIVDEFDANRPGGNRKGAAKAKAKQAAKEPAAGLKQPKSKAFVVEDDDDEEDDEIESVEDDDERLRREEEQRAKEAEELDRDMPDAAEGDEAESVVGD